MNCFSGLLNLRGSDIAYNPVFFGYIILTLDEFHIFVNKSKLPSNYEQHFAENNVSVVIDDYSNVQNIVKDLISKSTGKIWISPISSYALSALVPEKKLIQEVEHKLFSIQ